jgi:hypothetical protein
MSFRMLILAAVAAMGFSGSAQAVLRPEPGVVLNLVSSALTEGGATGEFTLALKIRPSGQVAIHIGASDQCRFSNQDLTFTPDNWNQAQAVLATAVDDEVVEGDHSCSPESILVSGADDYAFVKINAPNFTIADNDKSALTISNVTDGDEAGPQDSTLKVSLSEPVAKPTVVELTYGGTATGDGVDYSGPSQVTILAGETEAKIELAVIDDQILETTEIVTVTATTENLETAVLIGTAASRIADQSRFNSTPVKNAFADQSSKYLSQRLDFMASHGPSAQRLLNRGHNPPISFSVAGVTVQPTAEVPGANPLWNFWAEAEFGKGNSDSDFFLGYAGADYLVNDHVTLGMIVQGDASSVDGVDGQGWMVGPYLSAEIVDHVFLDLRGQWGHSSNQSSLDIAGQTYSGEFGTERWLFEARLAGTYDVSDFRITPEIAALYARDQQSDFTVSDGINALDISGQTVDLGRLSAGLNFTYLGQFHEMAVEPFVGAKLNWNLHDAAARGAVSVGVNLRSAASTVSLLASYDGIGGGEATSVSGKVSFSYQF